MFLKVLEILTSKKNYIRSTNVFKLMFSGTNLCCREDRSVVNVSYIHLGVTVLHYLEF